LLKSHRLTRPQNPLSCPHARRATGIKLQPHFLQSARHLLAQTGSGLYFFVADLPAFQAITSIKTYRLPPPTGRHFSAVI
jgi:hypothetical protein